MAIKNDNKSHIVFDESAPITDAVLTMPLTNDNLKALGVSVKSVGSELESTYGRAKKIGPVLFATYKRWKDEMAEKAKIAASDIPTDHVTFCVEALQIMTLAKDANGAYPKDRDLRTKGSGVYNAAFVGYTYVYNVGKAMDAEAEAAKQLNIVKEARRKNMLKAGKSEKEIKAVLDELTLKSVLKGGTPKVAAMKADEKVDHISTTFGAVLTDIEKHDGDPAKTYRALIGLLKTTFSALRQPTVAEVRRAKGVSAKGTVQFSKTETLWHKVEEACNGVALQNGVDVAEVAEVGE